MNDEITYQTGVTEPEEYLVSDLVKSEVNFLMFPFFALSRKGLHDRTEVEYRETMVQGDTREERVWNVSAHQRYGYPGPFDRRVHKAVECILNEQAWPIQNPVRLGSLYGLCQRMGLKNSGWNKKRIKEALRRNVATLISSENAFYHKGRKQRVTEGAFHLYDGVYFRGDHLPDGSQAEAVYLFLSALYLESLNAFYVARLDYAYLSRLRSTIASRLYEILAVGFYSAYRRGQPHVWFNYATLCQLLPISPQPYYSQAQQVLQPAHNELIETRFLSKVEWETLSKNAWMVYYFPGDRARAEHGPRAIQEELELEGISGGAEDPGADEPAEGRGALKAASISDLSSEQQALLDLLRARNLGKTTALKLVRTHGDRIAEKVEIFDWAMRHIRQQIQRPTGFLRSMIEEDWDPPEGFVSETEEKRRREAAQRRAEVRKQREKEQEFAEWCAMTPAQKVKGEVWMWAHRFAQEQGRKPTAEETRAQEQALIEDLPSPSEVRQRLLGTGAR